MSCAIFPFDIKNVTEDEDKLIKKYYKDYNRPFIRVGPTGYLATASYGDHAATIYNLQPKPDDIWVVSFSRSGTTWLQELVWLVHNNLNFQGLQESGLVKRFAFIEFPTLASELSKQPLSPSASRATFDDFRTFPNMASPRYVKSHLPLSLLPPNLLDTAKVLYVARDPRDVVISYHFMHKMFGYFDDSVTVKEFWDLFKQDLIMHTPIFEHTKDAWKKRSHPNLLFLFYEDMKKDLPGSIDKVCSFLDKEYSSEQKAELAQHLSFDNMKKNSNNFPNKENDEKTFFRKGQTGGWVQYFDEDMKKEADKYMTKNLSDTDMRFPGQ